MFGICWKHFRFAVLMLVTVSLVLGFLPAASGQSLADGEDDNLIRRLWGLAGDQAAPLECAAVVAIALLAAFLTVVQTWKIPVHELQPGEPLEDIEREVDEDLPSASAFGGNFGRTVLSGLGGMATVAIIEPFVEGGRAASGGIDFKLYYAVWFVTFFLSLLFASALFRGLIEALRSRVLIEYRPELWASLTRTSDTGIGWKWKLFYILRRFCHWLRSYLINGLVFFDTFFNVIQGRNQLKTAAVVEKNVVAFQKALVHSVDTLREAIDDAFDKVLGPVTAERDVRVNISLLSADGSSVFYVSSARGSSLKTFDAHSLAWLVASLGEARWWSKEQCQGKEKSIVVYSDQDGRISDSGQDLPLASYLQKREDPDYNAFVLLPLPTQRRGRSRGYRRGAVHISFRDEKQLSKIWSQLEMVEHSDGTLHYPKEGLSTLDMITKINSDKSEPDLNKDDSNLRFAELRTTLRNSVNVLSELLRGFNDLVYISYIKPQRDG